MVTKAETEVSEKEGAVLLVAGIIGFGTIGDVSGWWFAHLLLSPDVSMVGYLHSHWLGAIPTTSATSCWPGTPSRLVLVGAPRVVVALACVWITDIGMDQMFGYGLKYFDNYSHTHLGMIGRST